MGWRKPGQVTEPLAYFWLELKYLIRSSGSDGGSGESGGNGMMTTMTVMII